MADFKFDASKFTGSEKWIDLATLLKDVAKDKFKVMENGYGRKKASLKFKDGTDLMYDGQLFKPTFFGEEGQYQVAKCEITRLWSDEKEDYYWACREKE